MSAPQRQGEQASPISPQRRAATASEETQLDNLDLESGARLGNINIEIDDAKDTLAKVREVLDRLRKWHDWELRRRHLLRKHLLSIVFPRRPPCPSRDELKQLATFFFPSRASLIANICDYGEGRFQRSETPISKIEPGESTFSPLLLIRTKSTYDRSIRKKAGLGNRSLDVSDFHVHKLRLLNLD